VRWKPLGHNLASISIESICQKPAKIKFSIDHYLGDIVRDASSRVGNRFILSRFVAARIVIMSRITVAKALLVKRAGGTMTAPGGAAGYGSKVAHTVALCAGMERLSAIMLADAIRDEKLRFCDVR
jgi:hypothetical protein